MGNIKIGTRILITPQNKTETGVLIWDQDWVVNHVFTVYSITSFYSLQRTVDGKTKRISLYSSDTGYKILPETKVRYGTCK